MNHSRLSLLNRLGYASGDHALNVALACTAFFYAFYLVEIVGLRPALAGLVPLLGRFIDAITDPLMGRISDRTRSIMGRRRPYLIIGAPLFGLSFAALWWPTSYSSELGQFTYYSSVYILFSLSLTMVAVPYLALLPELARDYDDRNVLNTYRALAAILGTLVAVLTFRPLANAFGEGPYGFAASGAVVGLYVMLPWLVVIRSTKEIPVPPQQQLLTLKQSVFTLLQHYIYVRLASIYLFTRLAVDISTAMFLFYFTYWLLRPEDFEKSLGLLLVAIAASIPIWLRITRYVEKRTAFLLGLPFWLGAQICLWLATPEWPTFSIIAIALLAGIGYSIADWAPWSMLSDVIDEDELRNGERREGLYSGVFTFLRKFSGAVGVAGAMLVLDLSGYSAGESQGETTLLSIRTLTAGVPAFFITFAGILAWKYPLSRSKHREIQLALKRVDS